MTEQERQMITGLADRMKAAPAPQIDREADDLIRGTIGARPDALYVLTQTVLIQDMALKQAQAQIEVLKQQGAETQGQSQGGFLPQPGYAQGGHAQSRYSAPAPAPAPQQVVYEEQPRRSGFSDFLHSAATTAAGVIAGEVAFDSLASIFGHRGGYGGGGFFSGGGIMPGGETIVNNYYGDQGGGIDRGGDSRFADQAAASGDDLSSDIEDDRDQSGNDLMGDDSSGDDSGGDDFSGDDSGGGDSGF